MAKYHLKIKTTENYTRNWETLFPKITLVGDDEMLSVVTDAILSLPDTVEVRMNTEGSLQGHYFSTPESRGRIHGGFHCDDIVFSGEEQ